MSFWKKLLGIESNQEMKETRERQKEWNKAVNNLIESYDPVSVFELIQREPEILKSRDLETLLKLIDSKEPPFGISSNVWSQAMQLCLLGDLKKLAQLSHNNPQLRAYFKVKKQGESSWILERPS